MLQAMVCVVPFMHESNGGFTEECIGVRSMVKGDVYLYVISALPAFSNLMLTRALLGKGACERSLDDSLVAESNG